MPTPSRRILIANELHDKTSQAQKLTEAVEACAASFSNLLDLPIGYISVTEMAELDVANPQKIIDSRNLELKSRLSNFQTAPEAILRFGNPAAEIVKVIKSRPRTELVVVGTKGREGLEHFWLGSIAEDVIRHSPRPVAVVGPKLKANGKLPARPSIVLATDLSETAHSAENYVLQLAKQMKSKVCVVYCMGDQLRSMQESVLNSGVVALDLESTERELKDQVEKDLAKIVARFKKAGVQSQSEIFRGLAVDEVAATTDKSGDLIVMGSRGRNHLMAAFFGSTTRATILRASVPVVVVPPGLKS